eukprot:GILI01005606.1.p1 GENE.GILI01005606.1~~GILI01005606.1.p1  ORF type:complete len:184 (+),score=66.59 GILI01005606.1:74-625(+)
MAGITPQDVLSLTEPTDVFLCPLSANIYKIDFTAFKIRDLDSKTVLFEIRKDPQEMAAAEEGLDDDDESSRTIRYHFGPDFLRLRNIGTNLEFTVGPREMRNFRMIERHYFKNRLIKSYDFTFDFCIPNSTNTWEAIYSLPELDEATIQDMMAHPWETKSDSFYFVDNELVMHNKALYSYAEF